MKYATIRCMASNQQRIKKWVMLDAEQIQAIEMIAAQEQRSVTAQIGVLIAEALKIRSANQAQEKKNA
jgi:hypothetical protein